MAQVHIFSSMHVSGQQLDQYTGIAAVLRFPVILEQNDGATAETGAGHAADDDSSDEEDDFSKRCVDGMADLSIFSFA